MLCGWAARLAIGMLLCAQASAQAPMDKGGAGVSVTATGIVGTWQGTLSLPDGHDLRLVLKIA